MLEYKLRGTNHPKISAFQIHDLGIIQELIFALRLISVDNSKCCQHTNLKDFFILYFHTENMSITL